MRARICDPYFVVFEALSRVFPRGGGRVSPEPDSVSSHRDGPSLGSNSAVATKLLQPRPVSRLRRWFRRRHTAIAKPLNGKAGNTSRCQIRDSNTVIENDILSGLGGGAALVWSMLAAQSDGLNAAIDLAAPIT